MNKTTLSEIWIYPLKSARGIRLQQAEIDERGLKQDRRWMLVDKLGNFISQRKYPKMALIKVNLTQVGLGFDIDNFGKSEVIIPQESTHEKFRVRVWQDECQALKVNEDIDKYFSEFLAFNCHLVYMPDNTKRFVESDLAPKNTTTGFADAYPFLLISEESLKNLNEKLLEKVQMNRFRPNLVIAGVDPHEEDKWTKVKIADIELLVIKPCTRCTLITTNQETAEQGKEPLKTLSTYRKMGNKILFGQNLVHLNTGYIKEGQEVKVL